MDLKKDYEKLYNHWLEEFETKDITLLTLENFTEYRQIVSQINDYNEETKDKTKVQLLNAYKDNLNFLLKDLLKIRKRKIINSALSLKEIDLSKTIEAEKLLFQNLVAAIKGYQKVKNIASHGIAEEVKPTKVIESINEEVMETLDSDKYPPQEVLIKPATSKEKFNYVLLRFLEKTPALVGIDLINHGPFEKEDIANIPLENAKILINEKAAEEIDIS